MAKSRATQKSTRNCLNCGETVEGRKDKLFCSPYCKSSFHYQKRKESEASIFHEIDEQLKYNRALLKHFNAAGKAVVRKSVLLGKGFNPKYFTHYWKNKKGDVYLFCYEYGYLAKTEHAVDKYVLVKWQEYME
jgi:hypothetical protein